jgi:REP element-mobilizing transposase RayT
MRVDIGTPPMADPIAYFITWSTYGTWLPGDERGWVEYRRGWQLPNPVRELEAVARMSEDACRLTPEQRDAVEKQVAETCLHRGWTLHAANCRSNHLHVVVAAPVHPKVVRSQLKAWCTRRLKALAREQGIDIDRENWWAERGSQRYLNDTDSLEPAITYVKDGQDEKH